MQPTLLPVVSLPPRKVVKKDNGKYAVFELQVGAEPKQVSSEYEHQTSAYAKLGKMAEEPLDRMLDKANEIGPVEYASRRATQAFSELALLLAADVAEALRQLKEDGVIDEHLELTEKAKKRLNTERLGN